MSKLPRVSGQEVIRALSKTGFIVIRQKGSHVFMMKETQDGKVTTVVPLHKEIDKGTLLEILRQAKINREEFLNLV